MWIHVTALTFVVCAAVFLAEPSSAQIHTADDTAFSQMEPYLVRAWTTADGLPSNHILQILQTQEGYIWLATGGGLIRFNGYDFRVFTTQDFPGWTSSLLVNLYESRDGALWFSSIVGEVARFKDGEFASFFREDGSPIGFVTDWLELDTGALWIATRTGAVRVQNGQVKTFTTREGLPGNSVAGFGLDRQGNLTVATNISLARLAEDEFVAYGPRYQIPGDYPNGIYLPKEDAWWIIAEAGLIRLRAEQGVALSAPPALLGLHITEMEQDDESRLWLSAREGRFSWKDGVLAQFMPTPVFSHDAAALHIGPKGRLYFSVGSSYDNQRTVFGRFADGQLITLDLRRYLDYYALGTIYEDREGNVWVATDTGLLLLTPREVRALTNEQGLSHNFIFPIYQAPSGDIWIGTWGGGLNWLQNGKITVIDTTNGLLSNKVRSLHEDQTGNLWVGTQMGFSMLREGKILNSFSSSTVLAIFEDSQKRLWVSDTDGLLLLKRDVNDTYVVERVTTDHREIRAIHEDHQGRLWATSQNGLLHLDGDQWRTYTMEDGLSSNYLRAIYEEQDGTLWFTTYGNGLNRFKDNRFFVYTAKHGLHSNGVWGIQEDDHGNFWMTSDTGLFRVSKKELSDLAEGRIERITSVVYTEADGMPSAECNGEGWEMQDGQLWFPTLRGVAIVDPEKLPGSAEPPPVHIEAVKADGVPVSLAQAVHLPSGNRSMEISYAVLGFATPEKNTYRYKLEGYDNDWVEAGTRRTAFYTYLPQGTYTFRVTASSGDGVWSETGTSVSMRFRPYFYQTWWFKILAAGIAGSIIAGTFWLRRQRLLLQFERVRRRIADDLHDDVGSRLGGLALALDVAAQTLSGEESGEIHARADEARELLSDLRDTVWIVEGTLDTIEKLAERVQIVAETLLPRVKVDIITAGDLGRSLDMETRHHVLFFCKEALHNASRHGDPETVRITFEAGAGPEVTVQIEDDGIGFDAVTGGGHGLRSLRRRSDALGGTLRIASTPGHGTSIRLVFKA